MKVTKIVKEVWFTRPPKRVKIRTNTVGVKYFIKSNVAYYKYETGEYLPLNLMPIGIGRLGSDDYYSERIGF